TEGSTKRPALSDNATRPAPLTPLPKSETTAPATGTPRESSTRPARPPSADPAAEAPRATNVRRRTKELQDQERTFTLSSSAGITPVASHASRPLQTCQGWTFLCYKTCSRSERPSRQRGTLPPPNL